MDKGKNFSGNNLGQRKASDFYQTPYTMTLQLLDKEKFVGKVLEPACGLGAITKMLTTRKYKVESYDVETDFLKEKRQFKSIVTNPPFSLAFEFIQKSKEVATDKFALLLPLSYLHGKKRFDHIYTDRTFPLARIHVFTRYPMLGDELRLDGKYRTGMMVYAWFVWEKSHVGPPSINWLDNNHFILNARDTPNG